MRKHNVRFARRGHRYKGDTSNVPSLIAHRCANDKAFQLQANHTLCKLLGIGKTAMEKATEELVSKLMEATA